MHETSAQTWCSGRTWRERVGREVGGGIGMGKTCEPKAFSFQCMTKFTTKKKKKTDIVKIAMLPKAVYRHDLIKLLEENVGKTFSDVN